MNIVKYGSQLGSADTSQGPSQSIWRDCPSSEYMLDPNKGLHVFERFHSFGGAVVTNVGTHGRGYKSFESTSSSIRQINTVPGGAIAYLSNGADNDVMVLEAGYGYGGPYSITAGSDTQLWFETRIRPNATYDVSAAKDFFVGLGTKGMSAAATTLFSDTAGTMTTSGVDLIGFQLLNSGSALKTTLQKAGATQRTAVAASTLVASTWVKVGFKYGKNLGLGKKLIWYVDGLEVDSITDDTISTFPTAAFLTFLTAFKLQASDAAAGMDQAWYRAAMSL